LQPDDSLTIVNDVFDDLIYRKKADNLKQQLSSLPEGSKEFTSAKTQYDAVVANIQETLLKP
jgi:hypothetical protein